MARIEIHICRSFQDRASLAGLCAAIGHAVPAQNLVLLARVDDEVQGYLAMDLKQTPAQLCAMGKLDLADHETSTHLKAGLLRYFLERLLEEDICQVAIAPELSGATAAAPEQQVNLVFPEQMFPDLLAPYGCRVVFNLTNADNYSKYRLPLHEAEDRYIILAHGDTLMPKGSAYLLLGGQLDVLPPKVRFSAFQARKRLRRGQPWDGLSRAVSVGVAQLVTTHGVGSEGEAESAFGVSLYNCYVLAHIISAAHELGWFTYVGTDEKRVFSISETVASLGLQRLIFDGMFTYLEGIGLVTRDGDEGYRVVAARIREAQQDIHFLRYMVRGYGGVLQETVALARGELEYYKDLRRFEPGVGQFSPAVKNTVGVAIRDSLQQVTYKKMAYLGCGTAQRLIAFCQKDPELHAIGVDFHGETCEQARAAIAEAGLSERIVIEQADVYHWVDQPHQDVDMVFLPGGMMHDFLKRPGGKELLLDRLRKNLPPGAWFLVQDMNITGQLEPGFPLSVCDGFTFVHCLMGVPLYSRNEYVDMFQEAGWQLVHTNYAGLPNTWVYLLRNPATITEAVTGGES